LVKLVYITPAELNEALKNQVHEKIINCFAGHTGTFSFKFHSRFIDSIIIYKMTPQDIIFKGVKKCYDVKRLTPFLNTIKTKKFKIKNVMLNELDVFPFNTEELKIAAKLRSTCYYDELALKPQIDKLLLAQVLFTLSMTGYLTVAGKKEDIKEEVISEKKGKKSARLSGLEKETDFSDAVYETYLKIKSLNYYELLGVQRDADLKTIKNSYTKLAKKYHPDKYSSKGDPDILQKVTEIFAKLSNAFKTLTDEGVKKEYDYTLDHPKEAELLYNANEIIQSEMEFLKGEMLLNQGAFAKAQNIFEHAVKLNPQEPEYKCYFGWAYFLNPKNDKKKKAAHAKRLINESLEVNPKIESAQYFLGLIARFEGDKKLAMKQFKKTLQINPDNKEAKKAMNDLAAKVKK
jgi:curved DNA-binding protein CbpA